MSILEKAPDGANVFDLGSARQARAEARAAAGESAPVIKLAVGFVELKPEVDVLAAEDFAVGRIRVGLAKILADPADIDAVIAGGLSRDDLQSIVSFVSGTSLGE